jgi:hypothetical protein
MAQVPTFTTANNSSRPAFCWYNETTSAYIGSQSAAYQGNDAAGFGALGGMSEAVITTTVSTVVSFRILSVNTAISGLGGNTDFSTTGSYPWFDVEVISGYSPLVNGTSGTSGSSGSSGTSGASFNILNNSNDRILTATGNSNEANAESTLTYDGTVLSILAQNGDEGGQVFLNAPATNTTIDTGVDIDVYQNRLRLFENGGSNRGVYIDISKAPNGVGGEITWKASGLVNRGVDVTLGNLKVRMAATGNASLQVSTVTGTYSIYGSDIYSQAGGIAGSTIVPTSPLSVTTTPTYLNAVYSFGTAGSMDTWVITDVGNSISWRITMIVGSLYNNNMISIERLL